MKPDLRKLILLILIGMVIVPLAAGIAWPAILKTCDSTAQAGLFLVLLIGPVLAPIDTQLRTYFIRLCALWLAWGIWLLCWVFPIVDEPQPRDVPRSIDFISLLLAIPVYSGISTLLFRWRKSVVRRRKAALTPTPDTQTPAR